MARAAGELRQQYRRQGVRAPVAQPRTERAARRWHAPARDRHSRDRRHVGARSAAGGAPPRVVTRRAARLPDRCDCRGVVCDVLVPPGDVVGRAAAPHRARAGVRRSRDCGRRWWPRLRRASAGDCGTRRADADRSPSRSPWHAEVNSKAGCSLRSTRRGIGVCRPCAYAWQPWPSAQRCSSQSPAPGRRSWGRAIRCRRKRRSRQVRRKIPGSRLCRSTRCGSASA